MNLFLEIKNTFFKSRVSVILNIIFWLPYFFIFFMYLFIGDKTAFGEFFTIWPPILYFFLLFPVSLIFLLFRKYRLWLIALSGILIFIIVNEEWRTLLRFHDKEKSENAEKIRKNQDKDIVDIKNLRILTWNTSGADMEAVLKILESHKPDICFFQEASNPDAEKMESILTGYWEGFTFLYAGDCGILSSHSMMPEESGTIGPWADPQIVGIKQPDGEKIILCNVRLMLPSLVLNPFSKSNYKKLSNDNKNRINQFKNLKELLKKYIGYKVILGGDFNSPAGCKSISVLDEDFKDIWNLAGQGWGRTITSDFPVSRIDQIRISSGLECVRAKVYYSKLSDHRYLVSDLVITPRDSYSK